MTCGCNVPGCENRTFVDGADLTVISPQRPDWVKLANGDYLSARETRVTLTPDQMRELAADLIAQADKRDRATRLFTALHTED